MKKLLLLFACVIGYSATANADIYTVKGNIPDMADSCKIFLKSKDSKAMPSVKKETYSKNGEFSITDTISQPTVCEIIIRGKNDQYRVVNLMLDKGVTEIYAPSFDSIPATWYPGVRCKHLEKLVKVKGGEAQREFQEYRDYMYPYEYAAQKAHGDAYWNSSRKVSDEIPDSLARALADAQTDEMRAEGEFISEHPTYNISMMLLLQRLENPFTYSEKELDEMLSAVASTPWNARKKLLEKTVDAARSVVAKSKYTDEIFVNEKGERISLSSFVGKGKWVFIDFWASWCGPCRAAIPHVRKIKEMYPDKLTVISVSVDSEKDEWETAVKQEKMSWEQFWAPEELSKKIMTDYRFRSIPTLVLINPEGQIVLQTHSPGEIDICLERNLK